WAARYRERFGSLEALRREAPGLAEPVLVKTHLHPDGAEPAVYVTRDGRSAITSFLAHERLHAPESSPSLFRLILGDHFYVSWSEPVRAGREGAGATLLLSFGELRDGAAETLERLAGFVGHEGAIVAWQNPFEDYRRLAPREFGDASVHWEPTAEWDWVADALFWAEHGSVMRELGFDDGRRLEAPTESARASVLELGRMVRRLRDRLHELDAERATQAEAAAARAAALEALNAEIELLRTESG